MPERALPGFRDFFPQELAERNYITDAWRRVARRFGFQEYDGPPLEPLELYTRKSGVEIVAQLYNFTDKGGREVTLRPEMTPTFARMVGSRANALRKPVRWFSVPQLFRHERQQRGRLREHFQLNVDIVGEAAVSADAELVAVCVEVMREVGLTATDVRVRVSDRRLLNSFLSGIGVTREQLVLVYAVVDKAARDPEQDLKQRLRDAGLAEPTITTLFDALQRTREGGIAEILRTGGLSESATTEIGERVAELERYLSYTEALGIRDWLVFDLSIVRGLAYYTGIVFELFDARGAYRAICGGGRYDSLLAALGGADLPALGFGMGDVVLCELLRERGLLKATPVSPEFWVAGETSDLLPDVMRVATALRRAGHSVEFALREQTLGRQIKAAAAAGARSAVIMRHDLLRSGRMTVRELESGVEAVVDVDSWRPATE